MLSGPLVLIRQQECIVLSYFIIVLSILFSVQVLEWIGKPNLLWYLGSIVPSYCLSLNLALNNYCRNLGVDVDLNACFPRKNRRDVSFQVCIIYLSFIRILYSRQLLQFMAIYAGGHEIDETTVILSDTAPILVPSGSGVWKARC